MLAEAIQWFVAYANGQRQGEDWQQYADRARLVRDWIAYYLDAPCWEHSWAAVGEPPDELEALRRSAHDPALVAPQDIQHLVHQCLEVGIDPL